MSEPGEVRQQYVGQSLAYVRMLVGARAHYPSAKAAAMDMHLSQLPPPLGGVCFYDSEPWGNCGLYVGDRLLLTVSQLGVVLVDLDDEQTLGGVFIGWCPSSALREAGGDRA